MYTLFIDTHMSHVVIVLYKDGAIIEKIERESKQSHSILTMPAIEEILVNNNVDVMELNDIIVVNGPGSFTGVRIGVTIAKTLSYCLKVPIRVISSLEVLLSNLNNKIANIVAINDINGYFVGKFDKNNVLVEDYQYLTNQEYARFKENNDTVEEMLEIDYVKVYHYAQRKPPINPHLVNPLYVKKIEVQK